MDSTTTTAKSERTYVDAATRRNVVEYRDCAECSNRFAITQGEVSHYRSLGFQLPRRCAACRLALRLERQVPSRA